MKYIKLQDSLSIHQVTLTDFQSIKQEVNHVR